MGGGARRRKGPKKQRKKLTGPGRRRASLRIGREIRKGTPRAQAIAKGLSMARAGRLGPRGGYRAGKGGKRGGKR